MTAAQIAVVVAPRGNAAALKCPQESAHFTHPLVCSVKAILSAAANVCTELCGYDSFLIPWFE